MISPRTRQRVRSAILSALTAAGAALGMTAGHSMPAAGQVIVEPEVVKGQSKLESVSLLHGGLHGGAAEHAREAHALSYGYSFTEHWNFKAFLTAERPAGGDLAASTAIFENVFEIARAKRNAGIGLGWFTGITAAIDDRETNAVLFGPIVRVGEGPLSLVLNPFLEKTFGANRDEGWAFAYGWQVKQELAKGWWLGVEGFGRLPDIAGGGGAEEHRIGPLLTFEMPAGAGRTLTWEAGVQFGLNEATPETAGKLQVTLTY